MYIYNCNYYKALQIIANDFGFIHSDKLEVHPAKIPYSENILEKTEKAKIQVEIKEFDDKELGWWRDFWDLSKNFKKV